MKPIRNLILTGAAILVITGAAHAQNNDAAALIKQGVQLHDQGKYPEAIAKYEAALKTDPNNMQAEFEISYTLFSSGKGTDAISHLERVLKSDDKGLMAGAYDMLGSIYDDNKQPEKAIDLYKKGIAANPEYQRLHYNLAVSYYRAGNYKDAEQSATSAVKLDPRHASSQRIYAMTAYKLENRASSLLAWCSFLLLEPQSQRSPEAVAYLKNIINFGISKKDSKNVNINISPNNPANMMMPISVIAATEGKTNLSPVDSIQLQLTSLFSVAHSITDDKNHPFITNYYAGYFQKLAQSGNMPAFTRFITVSAYKDENLKWLNEHDKELTRFDTWVQATERIF